MEITWHEMKGIVINWQFVKDLIKSIKEDNVSNGAAALAYYLIFAIFPAAIFLLSILPYLPIPNLQQALIDLLNQAMPGEAAGLFTSTVENIVSQKRGGLVSFGAIVTLWAASNGLYAVMQQLNITYKVKEGRSFLKARATAVFLMLLFFFLIVGAFGLVIFGGVLQSWLGSLIGFSEVLLIFFAAFRWIVVFLFLLLGFATIYYFGPDVEQEFRFVSPGSIVGVIILALASLAFRFYVSSFGNYAKTYGSLGAVIILLLWLYIAGLVILLGSEVNALVEQYAPQGKNKGEKKEPDRKA